MGLNNLIVQRTLKSQAKKTADFVAKTYSVVKAQNPDVSESNFYICCLPVEINQWDYLLTPSHRTLAGEKIFEKLDSRINNNYFSATSDDNGDNVSDWEFEAWLERLPKTEVLSVGAIKQDDKRFKTFQINH